MRTDLPMKLYYLVGFFLFSILSKGQTTVTINFDDVSKWTSGSGSITSYQTDHEYNDGNMFFTGGPAIRNSTSTQDGQPGALGTYAWRLRDATVSWTATLTLALDSDKYISNFGFDARRWDGSPSPAYTVEYSTNGGATYTTASNVGTSGVLDNTAFNNSSAWRTFSQPISTAAGLMANQLVIRFSASGGERIMIDNFSYTISQAQSTFSGTGDWSDVARWDRVPNTNFDVIINGSADLDANISLNNLTIQSGHSLTISPGRQLSVGNTLVNNAGASGLVIESTAAGTGSLIHASANVDATVQRYITGNTSTNGTYDYHQVAVPLNSSGVAAMFLGSYLYKFDLATQTFQNMGTDVNTVLPNDQGYMIFYPDAHITYDFTGQLNSGPFSVPNADGADEFTLAPNPYPSAIDWDASSGWTKTNLYDAIWIWNPVADNYAAYGADAGTNGGTRYIPAGQAFFVKSSAPSSVLAMDNPVRVHNAQAFWKNQTTANNLIRIKTFTESASDEMIIRFNSDAMIGQDALDVEKMFGGLDAPQLYSISDERSLSINTLPFTLGSYTVSFAYSNSASIEAVLLFEGIESLDAGSAVFLEDLITNQMIDLSQQSSYAFTYDPAQQPERFRLHFAGVTSIDDQPEASPHRIWTADGMLYLLLPEHNEEEITIDLFDLQGRSLESTQLTAGRLHAVPLSQRGMLVARVTAGTKVYTSKLFIR